MAGNSEGADVEHPRDSDAPDLSGRTDRQPSNAGTEESQIDQILADDQTAPNPSTDRHHHETGEPAASVCARFRPHTYLSMLLATMTP